MFQILRNFIIFTALAPLCAFAESASAASESSEAPEASRAAMQQVLIQVESFKLSNGLRVIMYRRGVAPVFAGTVSVRVGGTDEQLGQTGIAHMLEHMAFKGTDRIGTKDFSRERTLLAELEEIAARTANATKLEGKDKERWAEIEAQLVKIWNQEEFTREYQKRGASGMNATTDSEFTKYFTNLPRNAFEFWCQMETDRIVKPVMRQFYQERDVVMEERRMRFEDAPDGRLYERLLGVSFLLHPYRNPVIGYEDDIRHLTATMVADFHRRYYVPDNIVVSLVGDVDSVVDRPVLERTFGRIPVGPVPARPAYVEPAQEGEREVVLEAKASPELLIAYHKPQYPDADDPKISVMLEVLAGSSVSPLYEELVKRKEVAVGVSHDEAPGIAYPNLMLFSLPVKQPHSTADVLRAFDGVVQRFQRKLPDAEEVEMAKRSLAVGYLDNLKSNSSLALDLAAAELVFGDWRTVLRWYDMVMAVQPKDVQEVAQKYLKPNARVVGRLERQEDK